LATRVLWSSSGWNIRTSECQHVFRGSAHWERMLCTAVLPQHQAIRERFPHTGTAVADAVVDAVVCPGWSLSLATPHNMRQRCDSCVRHRADLLRRLKNASCVGSSGRVADVRYRQEAGRCLKRHHRLYQSVEPGQATSAAALGRWQPHAVSASWTGMAAHGRKLKRRLIVH
jgi:hypothetical protein